MNKADFIYFISSILKSSNKFFVEAELFGRKIMCLIDTGADISMIHKDVVNSGKREWDKTELLDQHADQECKYRLRFAMQELNSLTRKKIFAFKTNDEPKYAIIREDVISKYLDILIRLMIKNMLPSDYIKEIKTVWQIQAKEAEKTAILLLSKYEDIFKEQLDKHGYSYVLNT